MECPRCLHLPPGISPTPLPARQGDKVPSRKPKLDTCFPIKGAGAEPGPTNAADCACVRCPSLFGRWP